MKKYQILFFVIIVMCVTVYAQGSMRLVMEGRYSENLYNAEYTIGLTPVYVKPLKNGRTLRIGFPVCFRGDLVLRDDYTQQTHYVTAGADVAYFFRPIFSNTWLTVLYGPTAHASYGFCPITYITVAGTTHRGEHSQCYQGSAGLLLPVIAECKLNKHWTVRLTENIVGVSIDSHYDKGYDDSVSLKAGLESNISPKLSIVWIF